MLDKVKVRDNETAVGSKLPNKRVSRRLQETPGESRRFQGCSVSTLTNVWTRLCVLLQSGSSSTLST